MTKVINFFGGPGTGKSTVSAYIFSMLKLSNINVELVTEYAKDKVWEGSLNVLENQIYVFGKQQHRLYRVASKVDVIVTDSPLLFSAIYDKSQSIHLRNLVFNEYGKYDNLNILLKRDDSKSYNETGRLQNKEESIIIDNKVEEFLDLHGINYYTLWRSKDSLDGVLKFVTEHIDPNYV